MEDSISKEDKSEMVHLEVETCTMNEFKNDLTSGNRCHTFVLVFPINPANPMGIQQDSNSGPTEPNRVQQQSSRDLPESSRNSRS